MFENSRNGNSMHEKKVKLKVDSPKRDGSRKREALH